MKRVDNREDNNIQVWETDNKNEMLSLKSRTSQIHSNGFRPLNTDFVNEKIVITFVKGDKDPSNKKQRTKEQLSREELKQRMEDVFARHNNIEII